MSVSPWSSTPRPDTRRKVRKAKIGFLLLPCVLLFFQFFECALVQMRVLFGQRHVGGTRLVLCAARPRASSGAAATKQAQNWKVGRKLVIVESPAKAVKIGGFLGGEFTVIASVGHIRDLALPQNIPLQYRAKYTPFGVDVNNGFEPYYVEMHEKRAIIQRLRVALARAEELYLATDGDREGEAIAWHLVQVLDPKVPVKRMVFNEITQQAIQQAVANTRAMDHNLVDAQETRRILDRLYGFEVSGGIRQCVAGGSSGGRVQSPATRLLVERERERQSFVPANFSELIGNFSDASGSTFVANLATLNGQAVASSADFDALGKVRKNSRKSPVVIDDALAGGLVEALQNEAVHAEVSSVNTSASRQAPAQPFTTSTLQQEAFRKLRMTARETMQHAQTLYEKGYITYMRTDSPTLSEQAMQAARQMILEVYGEEFLSATPRKYKTKSASAQEAHEAVRPAGSSFQSPTTLQQQVFGKTLALYKLIWKRTIASQMADSVGSRVAATIDVGPFSIQGERSTATAQFRVTCSTTTFKGFRAAYEEWSPEDTKDTKSGTINAAMLPKGQVLSIENVVTKSQATRPTARYNEATLIKELEDLGIGRPSTYASIVSTIVSRNYASRERSERGSQELVPSPLAMKVVDLLEKNLTEFMQYNFTADMENRLDSIAGGKQMGSDWLHHFYHGGDGYRGLRAAVDALHAPAEYGTVVGFGKHKGRECDEVLRDDPLYCAWVVQAAEAPGAASCVRRFARWIRERKPDVNESSDNVVGFGMHRGKPFDMVLRDHPKYCDWVLETCGPDSPYPPCACFASFIQKHSRKLNGETSTPQPPCQELPQSTSVPSDVPVAKRSNKSPRAKKSPTSRKKPVTEIDAGGAGSYKPVRKPE